MNLFEYQICYQCILILLNDNGIKIEIFKNFRLFELNPL